MRTSTRILTGAVVAAALLTTSGFTSVAFAAPTTSVQGAAVAEVIHGPASTTPAEPGFQPSDGPEVTPMYTRGFTITNMSSHPLKLESTKGMDREDAGPINGSVIEPGAAGRFEVTWVWGTNHSVTANYAILNGNGQKIGTYQAEMVVVSNLAWTTQQSFTTITMGQSLDGGDQLTVLDAPGSVIEIPAGQGQAQAQVLNTLCDNNPQAKCSFTPVQREKALGPKHTVDGVVFNNTPDTQTGSRAFADAVGTSQTVEVTASAKATILKLVEITVSAKYGHTWTNTHTFTTTENLSVRPYWKAWLEAQQPVVRDTGDFTVTLGNSSWHLRGVSFDTPDPNGVGAYVKQAAPMTPEEIEDHAPTVTFDADVNVANL